MIPPAEALPLNALITPTPHGIASRILAKTSGGTLTLFAFDAGQGLTEHTSPFEALVLVLEGRCTLTIGGTSVHAVPETAVRMPAVIARPSQECEAQSKSRFVLTTPLPALRGRSPAAAITVVCRSYADRETPAWVRRMDVCIGEQCWH